MSGELKAGLFVLAAMATIFYMATRITQNQFSMAGTKKYYANVTDATGLLSKTKVKMAGLDVGQLEKIELAGRRARITVEIAADLKIHDDASIAVKNIGLLGDKYLELFAGSDAKPVLAEGGYIQEGIAAGSIDQLTAKTSQLVDNLNEITGVLKEAMKGAGTDGDDGTRLDRILDNMEQFSQGLASMDKLGDFADRLTDVAENVSSLTAKINRGEGTLGKLISDNETIDRLNQTLSGVNKFVTKADKLQAIIDTRSAALTSIGGSYTNFSIALQPTYDKYYLLGIASRPQGVTKTTRTTTISNPDTSQASSSVVEEKKTDSDGITFNVQFAKRFSDFGFRLGLFESTGGLAADYYAWDDKVKLYTELYRFSKGNKPQLNVGATVMVYRPFYVWSGGDFLLSKDNRSYFIGAGIRFTDQDIKTLVSAALSGGVR